MLSFMLVVAIDDFYTKNLVSHINTHILLQLFHMIDYEYGEKSVSLCKSKGSISCISHMRGSTLMWEGECMHPKYNVFFPKSNKQSIKI